MKGPITNTFGVTDFVFIGVRDDFRPLCEDL